MPYDDFKRFVQVFDDEYYCYWEQDWYVCNCTTDQYNLYTDINIQIDDYLYTMTRRNYIEIWENQCYFKVMTIKEDTNYGFWIVGLNFFHNYYSVFDIDNQRIGFSVSAAASSI